jgi:hypothetical protein
VTFAAAHPPPPSLDAPWPPLPPAAASRLPWVLSSNRRRRSSNRRQARTRPRSSRLPAMAGLPTPPRLETTRHHLHHRHLDSFGSILPSHHQDMHREEISASHPSPSTPRQRRVWWQGDAQNRRAGRWRGSSAVGPTSPGWVMRVADVFCLSEMHELLESSIFVIHVIHCSLSEMQVLVGISLSM